MNCLQVQVVSEDISPRNVGDRSWVLFREHLGPWPWQKTQVMATYGYCINRSSCPMPSLLWWLTCSEWRLDSLVRVFPACLFFLSSLFTLHFFSVDLSWSFCDFPLSSILIFYQLERKQKGTKGYCKGSKVLRHPEPKYPGLGHWTLQFCSPTKPG